MPGYESEQRLTESEREKSQRFRFEIIRTRYVNCHYVLRVLLGQYLGVDFYNQEFYHNQYGKPSLKNEKDSNSIYFNLSNSENICIFAFTKDGDLGVDIEKIHDMSDMGRIVESFFSPLENKKFCSLPECSRKKTFFNYWTRKEALLKAMGVGLSFPLDIFDVLFDEDDTSQVSITTRNQNAETEWTLRDIDIFEGFTSTLALEGNHPNCGTRLRYFQLVNEFLSEQETMEPNIYHVTPTIRSLAKVGDAHCEQAKRVVVQTGC